jgi:anti-sigma-K factor RskA
MQALDKVLKRVKEKEAFAELVHAQQAELRNITEHVSATLSNSTDIMESKRKLTFGACLVLG